MKYVSELKKDLEKWWKNLDIAMSVAEGTSDIMIGDVSFSRWGDKHLYKKNKMHIHISNNYPKQRTLYE